MTPPLRKSFARTEAARHASRIRNLRLDTRQAAILLVKMKYLDKWTASRQHNADLYRKRLGGIPPETLQLPIHGPNRHVYNQFTVRTPNRDELRRRLTELAVATAIYYPLPLHLQEFFSHLGYAAGDFPQSEAAAREVFSLPIEPGLTPAAIATVAERLLTALSPDF